MKKNLNWKKTALNVAGVITGVVGGSILKNALNGNQTIQGVAGNASGFLIPAVVSVAGAVLSGMTDDNFLKNASLGVTAVGGAGFINELCGRNVVTLGATGNVKSVRSSSIVMPRRLPQQTPVNPVKGVGSTMPGMGSTMPGMGGTFGCF